MVNRWTLVLLGWLTLAAAPAVIAAASADSAAPAEPAASADSAARVPSRQAVVVFVESMSFTDFGRMFRHPAMQQWLAQGRYGAMSVRPPGPRSAPNAYLLMGSGGQALYPEKSGTAYHPDETLPTGEAAGIRYALVTGQESGLSGGKAGLPGNRPGSILFPGIYRLLAEQVDKPYTARVGLLGMTLAERGMPVMLFGNADMGTQKHRHAALFAMDDLGRIPAGELSGQTLVPDPSRPFGMRTDYRYLLKRLQEEQEPGLIVIELGDLARLYALREEMSASSFAAVYEQVQHELAAFLSSLVADRSPGRLIMLASAAVNPLSQQSRETLTPVAVWDGSPGGLLTSATTRQAGLVSGLDVLPTLLAWLHVTVPDGIVGHVMGRAPAIAEVSGREAMDDFLAEIGRIHHLHRTRSPVLTTYITAQIIVLIAAAVIWLWQRKAGEQAVPAILCRCVRLSLLAMLFIPMLLVLEPLSGVWWPPWLLIGALVMAAFGLALWAALMPLARALMAAGGSTAAVLLIDGFTGGHAVSRSYLGFDPVIGARFYGLGNELEGVLIGSAILFAASLYEQGGRTGGRHSSKRPLWAALAVFAVVLVYMAAPQWGTNAGGFLAGAAGFGVALSRLEGWRIGWRGVLMLAGGLITGVGILIAINLWSSQPQTHVGRVAADIVSGNWTEVHHIVMRKLEMNLKLLRLSAWSKLFAVSLFAIALLMVRPVRYLRRLSERHPHLVNGFSGIVAGSVAGLVLNDSGIVSAATCLLYFAVPALYAALAEREGRPAAL